MLNPAQLGGIDTLSITWYIKFCFPLKAIYKEKIVEHEYNTFTISPMKKRHIKNTRRRNLTSLQIIFFCIHFVSMKKYQWYDEYL